MSLHIRFCGTLVLVIIVLSVNLFAQRGDRDSCLFCITQLQFEILLRDLDLRGLDTPTGMELLVHPVIFELIEILPMMDFTNKS